MNLELIKKEAAKFFPPKRYPFGLAFSQDDVVAFAKHCVDKATAWRPIADAPKDGTVSCDWLFPTTELKHERWILCGESAATASVPGNATHWRYAQPLPPPPPAKS